jgi:hypothetical protein
MKDPAGLQATLRADGIPARVTFDPLHWMTQPLPAGCAAPKMSDLANAQLQSKILTPAAIVAYRQNLRHEPSTWYVTYTVDGQVKHLMVHGSAASGSLMNSLQKLRKEHAEHITVYATNGRMPSSLQKVHKREEEDAAGRSALYINPAAIPAGIGLSIGVDVASPSSFGVGVDLVVTSPQCTGS